MLRMAWPQTLPFGMMTCVLLSVTISVQNSDSPCTTPPLPPTLTEWPMRNGRKISSITPAARLVSVPCRARPIAREAAPRTATRLVVWMPNCDSTASTVTVSTK